MKSDPSKCKQKVLLKAAAPEIELLKEDDNTLAAPTPSIKDPERLMSASYLKLKEMY